MTYGAKSHSLLGSKKAAARHLHAFILVLCALPILALGASDSHCAEADHPNPAASPARSRAAYPLKISRNHRYLVDQDGAPFLIVGDSPQSLIGKLSEEDAAAYMASRASHGINALWINLLCNEATGGKPDGSTAQGIAPFLVQGDLSTPNPAYFQHAENIIRLAESYGLLVILDPIETIGWLGTLRANRSTKAYQYGRYLGIRFRDVPNVIWMHGNDFQSWQNSEDDVLVQAVARGIADADPSRLHTVELNYSTSGSLDDPTWKPLIQLDAVYTYFPTYAQVLVEYNRASYKPVFLAEANYEFEHLADTDGGTARNLRRQEYWTMLSGGTGQLYGARTWRFDEGWKADLNTRGVIDLRNMGELFVHRKWYELVPDQTHTVTTAGYDWLSEYVGKLTTYLGSYRVFAPVQRAFLRFKRLTQFGSIGNNNYVATARSVDGSLVIAYLPTSRNVTVDMSKLAGTALARWYDPTNATYRPAAEGPLANVGLRRFSSPGSNGVGDDDWVLLLETTPEKD